jgi:hypothetical protein
LCYLQIKVKISRRSRYYLGMTWWLGLKGAGRQADQRTHFSTKQQSCYIWHQQRYVIKLPNSSLNLIAWLALQIDVYMWCCDQILLLQLFLATCVLTSAG